MAGAPPVRPPRTLIIACGALAHELLAVIEANGWTHMALTCLPADLHNRPDRIPDALRAKIREARPDHDRILALYGDCGTGGLLDAMLAEEGVARIPGAHCYEFYAGSAAFATLHDAEPGTFYLTDYLVRHFETLVIRGLGLDRHPQLLPDYFGNYTRLVYLAQTEDADLTARARAAADRLGLAFEHRATGLDGLSRFLAPHGARQVPETSVA
ncbi:MAG: DUF1638 domain-containing protein [Hyphomicrobiales bacterium]|nr:DUF1638 domain-containing protein [Hyphomicrobiales bacterium]